MVVFVHKNNKLFSKLTNIIDGTHCFAEKQDGIKLKEKLRISSVMRVLQSFIIFCTVQEITKKVMQTYKMIEMFFNVCCFFFEGLQVKTTHSIKPTLWIQLFDEGPKKMNQYKILYIYVFTCEIQNTEV